MARSSCKIHSPRVSPSTPCAGFPPSRAHTKTFPCVPGRGGTLVNSAEELPTEGWPRRSAHDRRQSKGKFAGAGSARCFCIRAALGPLCGRQVESQDPPSNRGTTSLFHPNLPIRQESGPSAFVKSISVISGRSSTIVSHVILSVIVECIGTC